MTQTQPKFRSTRRIQLSLLDISTAVQSDDSEKATNLRKRIEELFVQKTTPTTTTGTAVYTAKEFFAVVENEEKQARPTNHGNDHTSTSMIRTSASKDVQQQIFRYLKTQDKYTSFVSILLKSQAFHIIYSPITQVDNSTTTRDRHCRLRPVVHLPRTDHNKPYIPLPPKNNSLWTAATTTTMAHNGSRNRKQHDANNEYPWSQRSSSSSTNHKLREEDMFSFSISHQYPFVGMAQIITSTGSENDTDPDVEALRTNNDIDDSHDDDDVNDDTNFKNDQQLLHEIAVVPTPSTLIVGMDIVTFDYDINKRLYPNDEDFLNVFRNSFTKNEWEIGIQHPTLLSLRDRVQEFYIRWSMKEAYTKAVGMGMGLEFHTFEIALLEDDDDSNTSMHHQQQHQHGRSIDNTNNNGHSNNGDNSSSSTITHATGNDRKPKWSRIIPHVASMCQTSSDVSIPTTTTTNNKNSSNSNSNKSYYTSMEPVWNRIISQQQKQKNNHCRTSSFLGRIRFLNEKEKDTDLFYFYFLPLNQHGCVCVCVGSLNDSDKNSFSSDLEEQEFATSTPYSSSSSSLWRRNCIDIVWTDIDQLVTYHQNQL